MGSVAAKMLSSAENAKNFVILRQNEGAAILEAGCPRNSGQYANNGGHLPELTDGR